MFSANTKFRSKILIIDDDLDDQMLIRMALTETGCTRDIITFPDGFMALQYLEKNTVDLFMVICDINMPRMNGINFKQEIDKDEKIRSRCSPFLYLSTSNSPQIIKQAYTLNPQGYFIKPDDIQDLMKMMNYIINYWNIIITSNKILDLIA